MNTQRVGDAGRVFETESVASKVDWPNVWLGIAKDHLASAERARAEGGSSALDCEFRASLVALTSLAFCAESTAKELFGGDEPTPRETATRRERRRPNRGDKLIQVLREHGLTIDDVMAEDIGRLFDLRNSVVHPYSEWGDLQPHPTGVVTSPEVVQFCFERAAHFVPAVEGLVAFIPPPQFGQSPLLGGH